MSESPAKQIVDEQRKELMREYHHQPSNKILSKLIPTYHSLVHKFAHQLKNNCTEPYEDIFQLGCIGLLKAIQRFDFSKEVSFSSFAVPYIKGEILHYLRDKSALVKVPRSWHESYSKLRSLEKKGIAQNSIQQAEMLGISGQQLAAIKNACVQRSSYKELPIHIASDYKFSDLPEDLSLTKKCLELEEKLSTLSSVERSRVELVYHQFLSLDSCSRKTGLSAGQFRTAVRQVLHKLAS